MLKEILKCWILLFYHNIGLQPAVKVKDVFVDPGVQNDMGCHHFGFWMIFILPIKLFISWMVQKTRSWVHHFIERCCETLVKPKRAFAITQVTDWGESAISWFYAADCPALSDVTWQPQKVEWILLDLLNWWYSILIHVMNDTCIRQNVWCCF